MRIPMVDLKQPDQELQDIVAKWKAEGGDPNFIRTFGRLPEALKRFVRFYSPLVRKGLIEHRTKELVRLRVAQLNQCHYCMTTRYALGRQQGIAEELVVALADYEHGPFTNREKVAMRYADQMYFDHHKVDDGLFGPLRAHFNEDEILELSWAIGEFISLGKIIYVLEVPYGEHSCGTLAGESH